MLQFYRGCDPNRAQKFISGLKYRTIVEVENNKTRNLNYEKMIENAQVRVSKHLEKQINGINHVAIKNARPHLSRLIIRISPKSIAQANAVLKSFANMQKMTAIMTPVFRVNPFNSWCKICI